MTKNYKNIIFDFDGVIQENFDMSYNVVKKFLPNLSPKKYKEFFEGNIYKNKELKDKNEFLEKFWIEYEKELGKENIKEEMRELIEELSKRYNLFILTSSRESILEKVYLKRNKIDKFFIKVYGEKTDKSKVKKFKMLFEENNTNKEESIFITDTLGDLKEANEVGVKSIGVSWGFHEKETLEKGNPIKIVDEIKELKKILLE